LFPGAFEDWSPGEKYAKQTALNGLGVWRNTKAWARVSLIPSLQRLANAEAVLHAMAKADFDPNQMVLTDSTEVEPFDGEVLDANRSARIIDYAANSVVVEVDAQNRCVLVLSDAYDPGWHVTVDGESTPVFPAYHAFRGVIVPEGKHEVVFEYAPRAFRAGLWMSVVGMTIGILLSVTVLIARKRRA